MVDAHGNQVAVATGGPLDGKQLFTCNGQPGDTFVPFLFAESSRPVYRLSNDCERWEFAGYEGQEATP